MSSCESADLKSELTDYIACKDAKIGVAVVFNGIDTVAVNGDLKYPMQSVYKFPQALAVAEFCRVNGRHLSDTIFIDSGELKENTYSPLRDRYGITELRLTIMDLLKYSLQQSDNNACDILFRLVGGVSAVDSMLNSIGVTDMAICSTEDDMHNNPDLCYLNSSTPLAMVRLLDLFDTDMRISDDNYAEIASLMENCATGNDRLSMPFVGSAVVVGHKTGTGDKDGKGRITAVNDVGYIHMTNGDRYSIAVFVSDSGYDLSESAAIIADISAIVYRWYCRSYNK